jgi:U3 small nucleolar RNA-associated protein 10
MLIKPVFAFFLDVFDLRHRLQKQGMDTDVRNHVADESPS